jgi:hypothetical protein
MTADESHGSEKNRDVRAPLSDVERARRYRARQRGEDVPRGKPGRPREPEPSHAERAHEAAGILWAELGWLTPDRVADFDADPDHPLGLGWFLDELAEQITRLRPSRTEEES